MISFVIPAHNEEAGLAGTLETLMASAEEVGQPYEVIVVNDASTDATAEIARRFNVRVLDVEHRHIAATRNAGGRAAQGDVLFFIDADTQVNAEAIRAGVKAIEQGAVGGGCHFGYAGSIPRWAHVMLWLGNTIGRMLPVCGGACMFCSREAFAAVGGFPERYYAAEDVAFVKALKRHGRFVIPREKVLTSNRKIRTMSFGELLPLLLRLVFRGPESFRSREGLGLWYGPEARADQGDPVGAGNGRRETES